jgi:hypothetical protein
MGTPNNLGVVGCYTERREHEAHHGSIFVRKTPLGLYHVLVSDKKSKGMCRIIAEVERTDLAQLIVEHLRG